MVIFFGWVTHSTLQCFDTVGCVMKGHPVRATSKTLSSGIRKTGRKLSGEPAITQQVHLENDRWNRGDVGHRKQDWTQTKPKFILCDLSEELHLLRCTDQIKTDSTEESNW